MRKLAATAIASFKSFYKYCHSLESTVAQPRKKMTENIFNNNTPIVLLKCEEAFNLLTEKEKLYAHHLSRACWMGSLISSFQTSKDSPLIFSMLLKLFSLQSVKELKEIAMKDCKFTEDDFTAFLVYGCAVLTSLGNYKGFGDSKFIPNLEKDKFEKLILGSKFAECYLKELQKLSSKILETIFSLNDKERQLGFPCIGTTTYLSKNFKEEDNKIVTDFFTKKNIEAYNSRLFKTEAAGNTHYEIRLASVLATEDPEEKDILIQEASNSHKFSVTRGDYSPILKLVNEQLLLAKEYAANENQGKMIEKYVESFHTGSLDAHKDGSRYWVKDKEPIIENYIGFIENYRDPAGVRGEFEGFVAMVNKPMSVKFANLVKAAENLLTHLPWGSDYEKDVFLQPDFSSLDVLTFALNDIPIGINIPNYVEIRQSEGFKNVTLGNVISQGSKDPPTFLNKADQDLFMKHHIPALEIQTGLHELLGHGSGKMFMRAKDGTFNFDEGRVLNYETNEKVSSWYKEGETFDSLFGATKSPYEECRAECVGLYLSTVPEVLDIFGHADAVAEEITYINWIEVIYAGITALRFYEPSTKSWLQAHCQAAYVILKVLLESEGDFISLEEVKGEDGDPSLLFTLDRSKIISHGKPCIGKFLKRLQLYISTANATAGKEMFNKYSEVTTDEKYPFLKYKEIAFARRKPRRLMVQVNTFLKDGKVELKNYEESTEGLIQSFVERFQDVDIYNIIEELWEKDRIHFE